MMYNVTSIGIGVRAHCIKGGVGRPLLKPLETMIAIVFDAFNSIMAVRITFLMVSSSWLNFQ